MRMKYEPSVSNFKCEKLIIYSFSQLKEVRKGIRCKTSAKLKCVCVCVKQTLQMRGKNARKMDDQLKEMCYF